MTDSQPHRITKSMPNPVKRLRYRKCSDEELDWRLQELKKLRLGTLTITSTQIHRNATGYLAVFTHCSRCGRAGEMLVNNVERGGAKGCKCGNNLKYNDDPAALRLAKRFHAIRQRCENPDNPNWDNYGGRGIKNYFKTAEDFVKYVLKELPHTTYYGLDIGRTNNNGHYEPGNLGLETRAQNARNKRNNHWVKYKGEWIVARDLHTRLTADYPTFHLSVQRTCDLAGRIPWRAILTKKTRKHWAKKLKSTTS